MKIIPKKMDKHHRIVWVDKPRMIAAKKWDGKFAKDPKGFFLIKVENGRIYTGRVQNQKMLEVVSGTRAEDIYYGLIRRKLLSRLDTAAYLGRELTRAEECLRQKKKYVQM